MSKAAHTLLSLSVAPVRIHKVIEAMNASPRGGRHVVHVGERFDLRQFLLLLLVGQGRGGHNGRECTWGGVMIIRIASAYIIYSASITPKPAYAYIYK